MGKIWQWFLTGLKRILRRPSFIVILLVCPCLCILLGQWEQDNAVEIKAGVYFEDDSETFNQELLTKLLKEQGIFVFEQCSDEELLIHNVTTGVYECGYVISSDLKEQLDQGKNRGLIMRWVSPATVSGDIVDEVFFSCLFELYAEDITIDYIENAGVLEDTGSDQIQSIFRSHLTDGSTFSFEYSRDIKADASPVQLLAQPVRGIVALFIFICGFIGSITVIQDKGRGIYQCLPKHLRFIVPIMGIAAPVILGCLSAWLGLMFSTLSQGVWRELMVSLAYGVLVVGFFSILTVICRRESYILITGLLLIILSLFATPIFIDFSTYVPVLKWIGKVCIPGYYLTSLESLIAAAAMVPGGLVLVVMSVLGEHFYRGCR